MRDYSVCCAAASLIGALSAKLLRELGDKAGVSPPDVEVGKSGNKHTVRVEVGGDHVKAGRSVSLHRQHG